MAKQQTVAYSYTCDLCGKQADGSYTVVYGGTASRPGVFEIDLCATDATKLSKASESLTAVLARGRKISGVRTRRASAGAKSSSPRPHAVTGAHPGTIRQWAREQGYEIADRGRIPAEIRDAHAKAN